MELSDTWQKARSQRLPTRLCFSDRSKKHDSRHGFWLAEIFATFLLKPLKGIQRNFTGSNILTSPTKFVFIGPTGKTRWPTLHMIGWDIFDLTSANAEWNSKKLDMKQYLNAPYQVCVFRADRRKIRWPWSLICWNIFEFSFETAQQNWNWKESMIAMSSTDFLFFGSIEDGRWLA